MRVRYSRLGQPISHLSGGNQQKIVLARWLMSSRPKLFLLDEPTRGIDVGAKAELYKLIVALADEGAGILLASSDMNELINLSHRVLVFRQGAIVGELDREELEQEVILRLAMGVSVN
jgi:ribose transport system ATP-binding protein